MGRDVVKFLDAWPRGGSVAPRARWLQRRVQVTWPIDRSVVLMSDDSRLLQLMSAELCAIGYRVFCTRDSSSWWTWSAEA
jgi:hypothetical protein